MASEALIGLAGLLVILGGGFFAVYRFSKH